MLSAEEQEMFRRGVEAVDEGDTSHGLLCLEELFEKEPDPFVASYYAVCLAKERGEVKRAFELCDEARNDDPGNPVHYLNLGRVYLAAGMKREAIKVFRDGLLYRKYPLISRELDRLGWRKPPVFPALRRENLLNRILGRVFCKLSLR